MKLKNLIDIEFCSAQRHYFASKKKYSNKLSSEIYFQVNVSVSILEGDLHPFALDKSQLILKTQDFVIDNYRSVIDNYRSCDIIVHPLYRKMKDLGQ